MTPVNTGVQDADGEIILRRSDSSRKVNRPCCLFFYRKSLDETADFASTTELCKAGKKRRRSRKLLRSTESHYNGVLAQLKTRCSYP
jgi:hypothetical protein